MTILDEGKQIRNEIAKLRPDKRRRYGRVLKRRILDWVERASAQGVSRREYATILGVRPHRLEMWRPAAASEGGLELVPVAVEPIEASSRNDGGMLSIVAPNGHRIEGLTMAQAIWCLRELA